LQKGSGDIDIENMSKIIKKANSISFCGQISDPIYHPNFSDILTLCSTYNTKKFTVNTNGTRKSMDWWKKVFIHKNIQWIFGLDGASQETANIYRINTNFEEVLSVMKLGASMGRSIIWQFIPFKHNEHEIEQVKQLASINGITLKLLLSNRWTNEHPVIKPPSDMYKSNVGSRETIIFYKPAGRK
jgi:MoaA/NifB/PqqE/SkfB family radical SAM enzyme